MLGVERCGHGQKHVLRADRLCEMWAVKHTQHLRICLPCSFGLTGISLDHSRTTYNSIHKAAGLIACLNAVRPI